MNKNLLAIICSNSKNKPYLVKANQIGVTRNAVAINPLTGYNVSTGNVMTQVANSSVSNMFANGDFETDSNSDGWVDTITAYYDTGSLDTTKYYSGSKSQKCTSNTPGYFGLQKAVSFLANHKYYLSYMNYIPSTNVGKTNNIYVNAPSFSANYNNGLDTWQKQSCIFSFTADTSQTVYFRVSSSVIGDVVNFDNAVLIDLSATFGIGFEPTRAWCDANIPFFTGTLSNPPWVNPLVTHNQYGYVGGDTTELTFDFGTKVVGSVSECPMKISRADNPISLFPPSDVTWAEYGSGLQSYIDSLKSLDSNPITRNCVTNNSVNGFLIELDLTSVCNQLFGGSNTALKNAIKSITFDTFVGGSGNGGNGVKVNVWTQPGSWGYSDLMYNSTSTISEIKYTETAFPKNFVDGNNKLYVLINATFPSNGTIASSVSLDYVKITIGLNRTADAVTPKNINLPKYFGVLVKEWSPSYDNNSAISHKYIFQIRNATNDTQYNLWWNYQTKSFVFTKRVNGVFTDMVCTSSTHSKHQTYNILCGQSASGMFCRFIPNNGSMVNKTNAQIDTWQGKCDLYVEQLTSNVCQGDSFINTLQLYDLIKIGKVKISSKNLINKADIVQGSFSGAVFADSTTRLRTNTHISVTPNTTYTISFTGTNLNTSNVVVREYDANKTLIIDNGWINPTFTTRPDTRYIRILVKKIGDAVIVPSDLLTIQLEIGSIVTTYEPYALSDGFNDYEAESILRGDSKYYQTTTADYVGKVPGSVVENPNIFFRSYNNTIYGHTALVTPYLSSPYKLEGGPLTYTNVSSQNGTCIDATVTIAGYLPQHIMSYNLIEITERKYGVIPTVNGTKSEKIDWLKNNIGKITCNWIGYGSSPVGAKALFRHWNCQTSTWDGSSQNNTSSPSQISYAITANINSFIDSDGYMHFLAYTDSARTTDSSYLVLTNHGLTVYDVIENVTRGGALAVITYPLTNSFTTWTVTGQVAGDTIKKYHTTGVNKTSETGTNDTTLKITAHGLSSGDIIKNNTRNGSVRKITVVDANTLTMTAIAGQVVGDIVQLLPYVGTQTAESGVASSVIYTDYASLLDVSVKTGKSSVYVPNAELFDINTVTLHANATRSNGVITLNANGTYQGSSVDIPVLPNNQYILSGSIVGANGYVNAHCYYNNTLLVATSNVTPSTTSVTFTTPSNCNKLKIWLNNTTTGTFTFSNISLKLKM